MSDTHRSSREFLIMGFADMVANRSTCERTRVGCVITNLDMTQIFAYGYNGSVRGGPNECDDPNQVGGCGCIHAESNALVKAPYLPGQLSLFVTMAPCLACAKLIVNAGIERVFYRDLYRKREGLNLLNHHIDVRRIL